MVFCFLYCCLVFLNVLFRVLWAFSMSVDLEFSFFLSFWMNYYKFFWSDIVDLGYIFRVKGRIFLVFDIRGGRRIRIGFRKRRGEFCYLRRFRAVGLGIVDWGLIVIFFFYFFVCLGLRGGGRLSGWEVSVG